MTERRPLRCSRCPDQETHMALVNGPTYYFALAHGETNQLTLAILEAEMEEVDSETCDHREEYGRVKKFDGGKLPILCGRCSHIVGWDR